MRRFKLPKIHRVVHLSFTPDGQRIAAVTSGAEEHVGSVLWLDAATGEPRQTIALDAERCALSPDHRRLAVSYSPYSTRPALLSPVTWAKLSADGEELQSTSVPDLPGRHVFALRFRPDGARLAIGCSDQKSISGSWRHRVHVVSTSPGTAVTFGVDQIPGEMAFSADGKWLAICGGPGGEPAVRFHRLPAAEPAAVYTPRATRTRRLVFGPRGTTLVALAGKLAVLLEAGQSEPRAVLTGHAARVDDAAFMADGRRLLTASQDGTVRVWDVETSRERGTFVWPAGKLTAVAVAPDGLTAAAAGEKGQIVIWDLDG